MKNFALVFLGVAQLALGGGGTSVGVGNPASKNCLDVGGKLVAISVEAGESELCKLGQALIESWTLFRIVEKEECTQAAKRFLSQGPFQMPKPGEGIGMANPSSVNCVQRKGSLVGYETAAGQGGLCQFGDRSSIEEWTLFRGPNNPGSARLTELLKEVCEAR